MPPGYSDAELADQMRRVGATYLATGPQPRPEWEAFVAAAQADGRVVETFANARFRAYRVVR